MDGPHNVTTVDGNRPRFAPAPPVEGVTRREVRVPTPDGIVLAGTLRAPEDAATPLPAVVLSPPGPVAVSDQSVVAGYAERFAAAGLVTLAVDPRNLGRSGGGVRQHFDVTERLRDLQAAVSLLTALPDVVDPARIGAFGASAGASTALVLAGHDPRIRAFVGAGGGFFHPASVRDMIGPDAYDAQLATAFAAVERFHHTGEYDEMPVVTPDGRGAFLAGTDPDPSEPFTYYGTHRGASERFENRVTVMSQASLLNSDTLSPAEFVGSTAGLLLAGTDDAYVPLDGTREAFRRLTGPKDLVMVEGANHIDLYDNAPHVGFVTDAAVAWFREHLGGGR